jgi:hypothetical protein
MLTSFFEACRENPDLTSNLKYETFPSAFTWTKGGGWKKRTNRNLAIGRLYTVSPSHVERFSLRALLLNKYSPKSFEDLRNVSGVLYPTFKEAAVAFSERCRVINCVQGNIRIA